MSDLRLPPHVLPTMCCLLLSRRSARGLVVQTIRPSLNLHKALENRRVARPDGGMHRLARRLPRRLLLLAIPRLRSILFDLRQPAAGAGAAVPVADGPIRRQRKAQPLLRSTAQRREVASDSLRGGVGTAKSS